MPSYRADARPTCGSCGRAIADDATLDDEGRPQCAECGEAAMDAMVDRRAKESTADSRRMGRFALAVLAVSSSR
jgi:hypothetical protein